MDVLIELKSRNELLFYFGFTNLILACICIVLSRYMTIEVAGVNAFYKPTKFALSIGIYSLTMGWLMYYLPDHFLSVKICSWLIAIMLTFEILYIVLQAARGQLSHFNQSSALYSNLYMLMAFAATVVPFITLYIAILFFKSDIFGLPDYYLWAIKFGLLLFFIFSMEGYVMGSNLSHTIGGADGGEGLPFLNWSKQYGDPRVAHFIGMHALQVLPLISYYLLKNTKLTVIAAVVYALLACYVLAQALQGKPLIK